MILERIANISDRLKDMVRKAQVENGNCLLFCGYGARAQVG